MSPAIVVVLLTGVLYFGVGFRTPAGLGLTMQVLLVMLLGLMLLHRRDPARLAALAVCARPRSSPGGSSERIFLFYAPVRSTDLVAPSAAGP